MPIAAAREVVSASSVPVSSRLSCPAAEGNIIIRIPINPQPSAISCCRERRSLRNINAIRAIKKGWAFPRIDASPAPAKLGLKNIDPNVRVVAVNATKGIHFKSFFAGMTG